MKVTASLSERVHELMAATRLNKTDLLKALVVQIDKDVVKPAKPANLAKLRTIAAIAVG